MRIALFGVVLLLPGVAGAQQWTRLDTAVSPGRSAAYDWRRGRLVLFGSDGNTFEYDGNQLLHRPVGIGPPAAPPPRARAQLVYDLQRGRALLFGGAQGQVTLGDSWTWDGNVWQPLTSPVTPPPRVGAGIAYDAFRDRVVMFGGMILGSQVLADTWVHDGTQWLQRAPATVPGAINSPIMVYDIVRAVTVLVTDPGLAGAPLMTSEWNGIDWQVRTPAVTPVRRSNANLAYDLVRQRTVMVGGATSGDEVWEWDGNTWNHAATVTAPIRIDPAAYFDPRRGRVIEAGGTDIFPSGFQGSVRSDAWSWDGNAMTLERADSTPPTRFGHSWFPGLVPGQMIQFGGMRGLSLFDDTWAWDGSTWTLLAPANHPSARTNAAVTRDLTTGRGLLFGGFAQGLQLGDLWTWTGTDWTLLASSGPQNRSGAGLAFDFLRGQAVLFGGAAGPIYLPASLRRDTWEWNGTTWTARPTTVSPPARETPAMTFDYARGRTVLFGGRIGATAADQLDDTWEWDGSIWRQIQTTIRPPALLEPSLDFDFTRLVTVLVGVSIQGSTNVLELWEYDGSVWTQVASQAVLIGSPRTVLDQQRRRLVLSDGGGVWEWSSQPASLSAYGAGCGAPVAVLMARTRPRIGEPAFGLETLVTRGQPVVFMLATGQGSTLIGGGCTFLLTAPAATTFVLANPTGMAVQ